MSTSLGAEALDFLGEHGEDPERLIHMVPRKLRSVSTQTDLTILSLGISGSVSCHLLLPDELYEELRRFHEDKVQPGRGLAALEEPKPAPSESARDETQELSSQSTVTLRVPMNPLAGVTPGGITSLQNAARANLCAAVEPAVQEAARQQRRCRVRR